MSLISLLIAFVAERYLSTPVWQFTYYYQWYVRFFNKIHLFGKVGSSTIANVVFIALPVIACYLLIGVLDNAFLSLIASTLVLIVCIGCVHTRAVYKEYLMAAFRGEPTTCELHHQQLLEDKNIEDMGFGQILVWLNYRYFIAVMIFFVLFGAPGAILYRLITTINEKDVAQPDHHEETANLDASDPDASTGDNIDDDSGSEAESEPDPHPIMALTQQILFWLDWLPVRCVAFGYMLVGHFSRAMPTWLDSLFDVEKAPCLLLIDVAQKSEDFMISVDDCTAEPCILVRLAKRTLLLCLSIIAVLILTGVLS